MEIQHKVASQFPLILAVVEAITLVAAFHARVGPFGMGIKNSRACAMLGHLGRKLSDNSWISSKTPHHRLVKEILRIQAPALLQPVADFAFGSFNVGVS